MSEADAEKGAGIPVGAYLKSVRESQGLNLDDASSVTKISKNYLLAIEAGDFDRLPSPAYIKGFLRLYASYLSLSGDEVIARYDSAQPVARPQVEPPPKERPRERPSMEIMERAKLGGPGRWAIPVVLLVLVIIAAIFFSESDEKREARQAPPPQPPPAPAPAPAPPPAAAVLPPRSSAQPQQAPPPQQGETQPAAAPATQKGGVVLRLRFNRDSWLSITIDDSISQRYDLKAGDVIEWKGSKAFVLDVGDGGAVEGEFNGKPFKSLGEPGKPAHVELKAPQQ